MKKLTIMIVALLGTIAVMAETFEGELNYRNFENHSKAVRRLSHGMAYNGARDMQVLVKGNVTLACDKTMHITTILNPDADYVIVYSDLAKVGLKYPYKVYADFYGSTLSPNPVIEAQTKDYAVKETGNSKKIGEWDCKSYDGTVSVSANGMKPTVNYVNIWYIPKYEASESYRHAFNGVLVPGIIGKWTYNSTAKVPIIGTMSTYVSMELKTAEARQIADTELLPPDDVKIETTNDAAKMYGFHGKAVKAVKKAGLYPTEAEKNTEVTYKIDEEWDF